MAAYMLSQKTKKYATLVSDGYFLRETRLKHSLSFRLLHQREKVLLESVGAA